MRSNVDRESHKKKTKSKEEDIIFPYHGFRFWTQYYFFFCSKDTILLYSTFLMFRHRIVFSYNRKGNITNNRVKTEKMNMCVVGRKLSRTIPLIMDMLKKKE